MITFSISKKKKEEEEEEAELDISNAKEKIVTPSEATDQ